MKIIIQTLIVFIFLGFSIASIASPPVVTGAVPKNGHCPGGWNAWANYCVAGSNAKAIVPKNGPCPCGWMALANYCVAIR